MLARSREPDETGQMPMPLNSLRGHQESRFGSPVALTGDFTFSLVYRGQFAVWGDQHLVPS
jgi:hypothetical protein